MVFCVLFVVNTTTTLIATMALPLVYYTTAGVTRLCIGERDAPVCCVDAVKHSQLEVTGWRYDIAQRRFVPIGCAKCSGCMRNVELSEESTLWSVSSNTPNYSLPCGLLCEACLDEYADHSDVRKCSFSIRYHQVHDVLTALKRAQERRSKLVVSTWRRFVQERKRRRALDRLTPAIMHWACKPDGPLARLALKSFQSMQKKTVAV